MVDVTGSQSTRSRRVEGRPQDPALLRRSRRARCVCRARRAPGHWGRGPTCRDHLDDGAAARLDAGRGRHRSNRRLDGHGAVPRHRAERIHHRPAGGRDLSHGEGLQHRGSPEPDHSRQRRHLRGHTRRAISRGSACASRTAAASRSSDLQVVGANPMAGAKDRIFRPERGGQHGFGISRSTNVWLIGVSVTDTYGDFVYMGRWGGERVHGRSAHPGQHLRSQRSAGHHVDRGPQRGRRDLDHHRGQAVDVRLRARIGRRVHRRARHDPQQPHQQVAPCCSCRPRVTVRWTTSRSRGNRLSGMTAEHHDGGSRRRSPSGLEGVRQHRDLPSGEP